MLDPSQTDGPFTAEQIAELNRLLADPDVQRNMHGRGGGIVYRLSTGQLTFIDLQRGARMVPTTGRWARFATDAQP